MNLDEIGQEIRKTRKNKKIVQEVLGKQLKMSRATISGIENGSIPEIGIRKVISLLDALGLEFVVQAKTKRPTLQQLIKEGNNG
jgi:transcriptional regulator with XRE-family HTH domain